MPEKETLLPRQRVAAAGVVRQITEELRAQVQLYEKLERLLLHDGGDDCSSELTVIADSVDTLNSLTDAMHALRTGIGGAFPTARPPKQ